MKKVTKQLPHEKEVCIRETKWYLLKLIDEKDELRKMAQISLILEHVNHLED